MKIFFLNFLFVFNVYVVVAYIGSYVFFQKFLFGLRAMSQVYAKEVSESPVFSDSDNQSPFEDDDGACESEGMTSEDDSPDFVILDDDDDDDNVVEERCSPAPPNVFAHVNQVFLEGVQRCWILEEIEHWILEEVIAYLESHPVPAFVVNGMYPL